MEFNINKIKEALEKAVSQHGTDHVDIFHNDSIVYLMYHSRHNSFQIGDDICRYDPAFLDELERLADMHDVCVCEE